MMSSTVRHVGFNNPAIAFPTLERRSLAVNTATLQLAVGNEAGGAATGQPLNLLAIRYFTTTAQYVVDDMAIYSGQIYRAKVTVAPGPFDASQWVGMTDGGQFLLLDGTRNMYGNFQIDKPGASIVINALGASQADIWFRRDGLTRWLIRSDQTSAVDFFIARFNDAGFVIDTPIAISRSTGRVSILSNPTLPLELVPKQYVDAGITTVTTNVNDRVLRAGDTMTGGLVVPVLTIKNPSYSDLYFANTGPARWLIRGADTAASNLEFHYYAPDGTYRGAALVLDNANGNATFQGVVKTTPGLQFGGNAPVGFYGDGANIAIRTYGGNGIYFQNAGGANTYGLFHAGGLDVYGFITSTLNDGLRNTVPAGQNARTLYTVSGVRQRSAGTLSNGDFQITDESAGRADIRIDTNGKVWFANDVNVPGMLTVNNLTVTGSTTGGGPAGGGGIDVAWIEGPHYIDFRYPGDAWDNSARIIVNGASPSPGSKSPLEIQSGGVTISSNLHVTGIITSGGGGTSPVVQATGYQQRKGTPGPFGPFAFNLFYPGGDASGGGPVEFWSGANMVLYLATTSTFADFEAADDTWQAVSALKPTQDSNGNRPPMVSDAVITALTKALQQAMARIEALELKVQELTNAGAR